jgi:DNA polymerase (family 10)
LSYFTGSKNHNVRLRELALRLGYTLNEHAFTALEGGDEIHCATEDELYETLGLPFIPAVLREDRGEIEAAIANNLPKLVTIRSIISDLHMHSTWSDGRLSILEMARAAQKRGFKHIVISDHSASLGIANGLSQERLRLQADEIAEVNQMFGLEFRILHGTEMEIRADGNLDYPDEVLDELDFVIASVHVSLRQPREQIMDRLMAALENPHVDMIAHPTGRLLPDRPPADIDMEALFRAAVRTGTILEINANPQRLDLRDNHVRRAVQLGVKLSINCDAHAADHFEFLPYGVALAQRGWAQANDIVNTWSVEKLITFVGKGSHY